MRWDRVLEREHIEQINRENMKIVIIGELDLGVLISWLLVSALSMVTAAFQQSPYCPVSNETGSILCATDVPSSILTDTSKTRCSLACMSSPGSCAAFNYNTASRECGLYNRTPTGFRSDTNCTNYMVSSFNITNYFTLLILHNKNKFL